MRQTTGFYFICTFLCVIISFNIRANGAVFEKADSFYVHGDLLGAIVECERIAYFTRSVEVKALSVLKQVEYFKKSGKYKEAKDVATSFNIPFSLSEAMQFEIRYQSALCAHLAEQYDDARLQLAFINAAGYDSLLLEKSYLLQAFNTIELHNFKESKKWMVKEVSTLDIHPEKKDSLMAELEYLFSKKGLPNLKKTTTAFWLGFVPGLGHAYAGEYKEGAVAFILNAAALSFGAHQIYNGFYLTGYFTGAGMLVKLFYGSRDRMDYLIEKRNFREIKQFKKEVGMLVEGN